MVEECIATFNATNYRRAKDHHVKFGGLWFKSESTR